VSERSERALRKTRNIRATTKPTLFHSIRFRTFFARRSFEQEMFDRASKKLGLEQAVLGTFQKDDDDGQPTSKVSPQRAKRASHN